MTSLHPSRTLRSVPSRRQRGFSLVELMTTVGIVLALSSIAVGSFFLFRDTGEDTAARSTLRELESTQKFYHRNFSTFLGDPLDLEEEVGTQYTYLDGSTPSAGPEEVSVLLTGGGDTVSMAAMSGSGECQTLRLTNPSAIPAQAPVTDSFEPAEDSEECTGASAEARTGTNPWGLEE